MQLSFNIDIQLIQNNLAPVVQKLDSAIQWLITIQQVNDFLRTL